MLSTVSLSQKKHCRRQSELTCKCAQDLQRWGVLPHLVDVPPPLQSPLKRLHS